MSRSEVNVSIVWLVLLSKFYAHINAQLERAFKVLEGVALDGEGEAASSSQNQVEGL
jgi:hypothetical protein